MMLIVLLTVSLVVTVALTRQAAQTRVIHRQLNEYRLRHDMHGIRAIVLSWIKNISRTDLATFAATPGASHVFELPSGARAVVRVTEGQGFPLRNPAGVDAELRDGYDALLARLSTRPDLTRGVGPWQISVGGSPREVLEAMVSKNGPSFADAILRLREARGTINRSEFSRVVSTMNIEGDDRLFVTRVAVFDSTLWRISVETEDWSGKRRYDMLVERTNTGTTVHEWYETTEAELRSAGRTDGKGS